MSINTDPSLYSYSTPPNVCDLCYDANKSPETIFLISSGIQTGALWLPTDPPPPNGIFELTTSAPCNWSATIGVYDLFYGLVVDTFEVSIDVPGPIPVFFDAIPIMCSVSFANFLAAPAGNHYYGGFILLLPVLEGGADSLVEIMSLLSKDPLWATWANPQQINKDQTVHKFYNSFDKTNVKVLYEP